MDMVIKGRHMEVSPATRAYAEEKIGKVSRLLNGMVMDVEVELYQEKNPSIEMSHVAEVTIHTKHPGPVIRAREASTDMRSAIDMVVGKLERQAMKVKGKLDRKHVAKGTMPEFEVAEGDDELEEGEGTQETEGGIVKRKSLELKPMAPEEAVLQLELLGHDFFVFTSAEDNVINVLYKRRDGDYGLIVPKGA